MHRYCVHCKKDFPDKQDSDFFDHYQQCKLKSASQRKAEKLEREKAIRDEQLMLKEMKETGLTPEDIIAAKKFNAQKQADIKAAKKVAGK